MPIIHYSAIATKKEKLLYLTRLLDVLKKHYEIDLPPHLSEAGLIPVINDIVATRNSLIEFKSHILISIEHMLSPRSVFHQLKPNDSERTIYALNKKMHDCETCTSTIITQLEAIVKLLQEPSRRHADIIMMCQTTLETIGMLSKQIENLDWLSYVLYDQITSSNKNIAPAISEHAKELFWFDNINSWNAHPFAIKK